MSYTHTMHALPSAYETTITEKKWQDHWVSKRIYAWDETVSREQSYVIDTPPPTVSGLLHMGHVFSYTQADFIARYQRMKGMNVFYPMGFDDNGLPTERLVEKSKKIRAADIGREKFIEECESVAEEARKEFRALFQSIALSVDWDQEYHTISEDCRRLSQMSFLDLVQKGDVYRKLQPMLWDPIDQTAIAQAEVVDKEMASTANHLHFIAGDDKLEIMTTRPELLPACVALFCHPDDARYTHLHGKTATVPLFGFDVPIMTDDAVEMEKGTGLMMCCTFGDEKDIEKWQKYNLPTHMILNKYGKLNFYLRRAGQTDDYLTLKDFSEEKINTLSATELAEYSLCYIETGSDDDFELNQKTSKNFQQAFRIIAKIDNKKVSNADAKHPGAREIILAELEAAGLLLEKKPITHVVKTAERSGATLELIPTHQWFVKVLDKKEALKEKARACNWNPDWMRVRIEQWIDGLNWDWCISRQRYFGVPFPVWYSKRAGEEGKLLFAEADQLPVNPIVDLPKGYSADEVIPDFDVMDTWATSSISPQMNAGAITGGTDRFNKLFPADLRPQAHEIIRTWAFYTIVKAHLHTNTVPWKNLMISGWCLAEDKTKMSKSKGNVVTPVDLINERGTDAVRYWAATSRLGQDTAFSPDLLKIGKKLVGKLWNATQFAAIHLSKLESAPAAKAVDDSAITEVLDQWIISRLHDTVKKATEAFERYEYADALDATNQFFWADLCDNYLELIKKRVYNEDGSFTKAQQLSAVHTLYHVLKGFLKLYAPIVPHVTEELYSHIFADEYAKSGSLHSKHQWPSADDYARNDSALAYGEVALAILEEIRKAKSDGKVSIKFPVERAHVTLEENLLKQTREISSLSEDLKGAGNVTNLEFVAGNALNVEVTLADQADAA